MSSSVRLSSVCLSSVCNVRAPYTQAIEIFGNVSTLFGTLAIHDLSVKILRSSSQGNPSAKLNLVRIPNLESGLRIQITSKI